MLLYNDYIPIFINKMFYSEKILEILNGLIQFTLFLMDKFDGFGGLVVSILATGTRVRGRSRWIFRASEKSSVCLPSEGK
jgi:hypothetical protein